MVKPLLGDRYLRARYENSNVVSKSIAGWSVARRVWQMWSSNLFVDYDVLWLEKEIFPWCMPWITKRLIRQRAVLVDFDDAVFSRYESADNSTIRRWYRNSLASVAEAASVVTVGNDYLAARLKEAGARRVEIVPSSVDLDRYPAFSPARRRREVVIGWIGTPITQRYLFDIADALGEIQKRRGVRIRLIGANRAVPGVQCDLVEWRESTEVDELAGIDIGIMPLADGPFEQGKCGYKLIQYMGCWKPVVASPVGVNRSLVRPGVNGFLATRGKEWIESLEALCSDEDLRRRMGDSGRALVERQYSIQSNGTRLIRTVRSILGE